MLSGVSRDIVYRRTSCRLCDSLVIDPVLRLAASPLADAYIPGHRVHEEQKCYPLDLFLCRNCGFLQLVDIVIPQAIYFEYLYETKTSLGLVEHFNRYADSVIRRIRPPEGSLIVDIGSNDGSLLRVFQKHGFRVLGVDPAREIARQATSSGVETLPELFTSALAETIVSKYGRAAVITCNNLYANVDVLTDMTKGIRRLLQNDGVLIFESFYLVDLLKNMVFDFIYHEHLSYFSVKPLQFFFKRMGLELIDVESVSTKGGSLRYTVQLAGGPRKLSAAVDMMIQEEENKFLDSQVIYRKFTERIGTLRQSVLELIDKTRAEGRTVAAYGASATSTTFLYHFGLTGKIDYIIDDNPQRQNLFSPGAHIPVVSSQKLYSDRPDYVLILAWRYFDTIHRKHEEYLNQGGRFIVPLPELRIVSAVSDQPADVRV